MDVKKKFKDEISSILGNNFVIDIFTDEDDTTYMADVESHNGSIEFSITYSPDDNEYSLEIYCDDDESEEHEFENISDLKEYLGTIT